MAYRALEKLINLHDGYRRPFRTVHGEVLLIHENGETLLINRHCPHRGLPLDSARLEGGCLTCPHHQLRFSLRDGRPLNGDCAALGVHAVAYEGNSLGLEE